MLAFVLLRSLTGAAETTHRKPLALRRRGLNGEADLTLSQGLLPGVLRVCRMREKEENGRSWVSRSFVRIHREGIARHFREHGELAQRGLTFRPIGLSVCVL